MPPISPSQAEKEQALSEVLESQGLARSEQLKTFLRYVCQLEIAGRAAEIKEYSVGTEALGRPATYSPASDSTVRRRAFELRSKLEELYQTELGSSQVIIDLPKGSYVPVFRYRSSEADASPAWSRRAGLGLAAGALFAGILAGALGMRVIGSRGATAAPVPVVIHEAWGPIAEPNANALLCVAAGFHMAVRPGGFSPEADLPSFPAPAAIDPLFEKVNPWPGREPRFMRPAQSVATLGVVGGVAAAAALLRSVGATYQILPERTAPLASFRGRNVVLFGDALTSFAASQLLNRAYLTIAYNPDTHRMVIRDRRQPASTPPAFSRREGGPGSPAEVFGLLTVMPADAAPGQHRRTLIVSGVSNVGIQGAMEFFTAPEQLLDLKNRFRAEGLTGFPKSYQLVIRCSAQDSLPLSCGYAAHYVLER